MKMRKNTYNKFKPFTVQIHGRAERRPNLKEDERKENYLYSTKKCN